MKKTDRKKQTRKKGRRDRERATAAKVGRKIRSAQKNELMAEQLPSKNMAIVKIILYLPFIPLSVTVDIWLLIVAGLPICFMSVIMASTNWLEGYGFNIRAQYGQFGNALFYFLRRYWAMFKFLSGVLSHRKKGMC